jgi:hypothetical protein
VSASGKWFCTSWISPILTSSSPLKVRAETGRPDTGAAGAIVGKSMKAMSRQHRTTDSPPLADGTKRIPAGRLTVKLSKWEHGER